MKRWGRREKGEKANVGVNYFLTIIIFAPTRSLFCEKETNTYNALSRTIVNASIDEELRSVLRTFLLAFSIGFGGKWATNRAQKLLDFVVRDVTDVVPVSGIKFNVEILPKFNSYERFEFWRHCLPPAAQTRCDRKLLSRSLNVAREQEIIMIKRCKGGGGEKKNVGVKYFSAIMIFAPTRLRPGAFLSERDKHR